MPGIFDAFSNGLHSVANNIRNANFTPAERRQREDGKRFAELVKLASIVSVAAAAFFAALFTNLFTILILGATAVGAHEFYRLSDNVIEMLDKAIVELKARTNKENLVNQLTKNTLVLKSIINVINPDFDPILFA